MSVFPFGIIGTNMCRALHDNHNQGHIWEEFSSETLQKAQHQVVSNKSLTV
jgi:hypothetical protein